MAYHPTGGPSGRATDAVAVRSILSTTGSLRLRAGDVGTDLIDAHAVLPDGTVVLAVDAMTPLGGRLVAARGQRAGVQLDVTELVAVPVRSRVRARVTVHGTVRPFDPQTLDTCDADTVLALLDLPAAALWSVEPVDVRIEREHIVAAVAVPAYRAARPDPVAAVEAAHLQHLARRHGHHGERLAALAGTAAGIAAKPAAGTAAKPAAGIAPAPTVPARWAPTRFVPIAIDAEGLTLRAEAAHRYEDIRLPFARRVTTEAALAHELRALLARAAAGQPAA